MFQSDREDIFQKQIIALGDSQIVTNLGSKVTPDLFPLIAEISAEVKKFNGIDSNVEFASEFLNSVRITENNLNNGCNEILRTNREFTQQAELIDDNVKTKVSDRSSQGRDSNCKSQGTTATPIYLDVVEQSVEELQSK